MGIRTVTPPTVAPIDVLGLQSLKQHLNEALDVEDNDALITSYTQVAWDYCERYLWRTLLTKELRLTLSHWFAYSSGSCDQMYRDRYAAILLPRPRIISVESVEYYDDANELQTMPGTDWSIDLDTDVPELCIYEFPSLYDRPDAVRINYTAGYGTTEADFPPVLIHAVRLLVGDYYRTREPSATDHATVNALLGAIEIRDERLMVYE